MASTNKKNSTPLVYDIVPKKTSSTSTVDKNKDESSSSVGVKTSTSSTTDKVSKFFSSRRSGSVNNKNFSSKKNIMGVVGVFVVLVVLGLWISISLLPKAEVRIVLKEYPIQINRSVVASSEASESFTDGDVLNIPGEVLVATKSVSLNFPTKGREEVFDRAKGKLTIYNAYGSDPQILVAKTRFESSDGKVFRIQERVTVPGASVENGVITPSSVSVSVLADESGESYNLGPVAKWTIPGFAGTPRFDGFYASSDEGMSGGFSGERAVPSEEEISDAKEKARSDVLRELEGEMRIILSSDFEVFDGSTNFEIISETVESGSSDSSMFSVVVEARLSQIVFRGDDLKNELISESRVSLNDQFEYSVDSSSISYEGVDARFSDGEISFTAVGNIIFKTDIDTDKLAGELLGKDAKEVKEDVFRLPGLERAYVSLWPFWVKKVPNKGEKLTIVLE